MASYSDGSKPLRAQTTFFLLSGMIFVVVAYDSYVSGALVNYLFKPSIETPMDPLGLANMNLLVTGMFVLFGVLMVSMGLKYRAHKFSRKEYKLFLVLPVSVIVCLAFVNVFLLPQELKDQNFYSKALSTNEFKTNMVESHYDSEDGTWSYKYSVEFIDYRTGNLIKTTTGWSGYPTAMLLYNPEDPAEVRFDTGVRSSWAKYLQSNVGAAIFISDGVLAMMIFSVVRSPLTSSYLEESKEIGKPKKTHINWRRSIIVIGFFIIFFLPFWLVVSFGTLNNLTVTVVPTMTFFALFIYSAITAYMSRRHRSLPKVQVPSQPSEIFHTLRCPKCGTELLTDAEFCPQCGTKLPPHPTSK